MGEGLAPERPGIAPPPDLVAWRAGLDGAVASGMFQVDPAPEQVMLDGVPALRFAPDGVSRGTVLHFHGGGFRLGCPEQVGPFAAALAAHAGVTVVCPRYRLAPEHPFPAGLNDARSALTALQASGESHVILSGDSAGGGIAAGLAALAGDDAIGPVGLILLSPWLDLTVTNASFGANAACDHLFSRASAEAAAASYLQDLPPDHPSASPGLGLVSGYPPTFVNVGSEEVLLDDSRRIHARLDAEGIASHLQIVPGMEHVAVTRGAGLPGAADTYEAVIGFLDRLLEHGPAPTVR